MLNVVQFTRLPNAPYETGESLRLSLGPVHNWRLEAQGGQHAQTFALGLQTGGTLEWFHISATEYVRLSKHLALPDGTAEIHWED